MSDRPHRIIILGGGWSVKDQNVDVQNLRKHGFVIGINDGGIIAPCDVVVSMDREWLEHRWDRLIELNRPTWVRESAWRVNMRTKPQWPGLYFFQNDHESEELSAMPDNLDGFNSLFCGLNMAYQLKPAELFIFGLDHKLSPLGDPYWYPPYPWTGPAGGTKQGTFKRWSARYDRAAEQLGQAGITTFNVNLQSAVESFSKINYKGFQSICAK